MEPKSWPTTYSPLQLFSAQEILDSSSTIGVSSSPEKSGWIRRSTAKAAPIRIKRNPHMQVNKTLREDLNSCFTQWDADSFWSIFPKALSSSGSRFCCSVVSISRMLAEECSFSVFEMSVSCTPPLLLFVRTADDLFRDISKVWSYDILLLI